MRAALLLSLLAALTFPATVSGMVDDCTELQIRNLEAKIILRKIEEVPVFPALELLQERLAEPWFREAFSAILNDNVQEARSARERQPNSRFESEQAETAYQNLLTYMNSVVEWMGANPLPRRSRRP